jgi:hypothetical protein
MKNKSNISKRVNFTIQNHNLRCGLLCHFLISPVYTYATGIEAYKLSEGDGMYTNANTGLGANGEHASHKMKPQEPRKWLLCKIVLSDANV